jgi:hypothetical protein
VTLGAFGVRERESMRQADSILETVTRLRPGIYSVFLIPDILANKIFDAM